MENKIKQEEITKEELSQAVKDALESYQCAGCTCGSNISCYEKSGGSDISCGKHSAGTMVLGIGWLQIGLPNGFNRVSKGQNKIVDFYMFETYDDKEKHFSFDVFNIPVWKYLHNGHTLIRGISPRTNTLFIQCILEDCMDKIDCLELTTEQVKAMD